MIKKDSIGVIDLFSGPGGLGEGFSNCKRNSPFRILMSVEADEYAHKTLTLRSFYRKLSMRERETYFRYVSSQSKDEKEESHQDLVSKHSKKWATASNETLGAPHALGNPKKWEKIRNKEKLLPEDELDTSQQRAIFARISEIKRTHKGPLIVIGGPPCQAYSVNGRNRIRSEKYYRAEDDERFFLYKEYIRVVAASDPDMFVMENVEGMLSAKLANNESIFEKITSELRAATSDNESDQYDLYSFNSEPRDFSDAGPVYEKKDFTLNACHFGVPQRRKRVIILGIKRQYGRLTNTLLERKAITPTISQLIGTLPKLRSDLSEDLGLTWHDTYMENLLDLERILSNDDFVDSTSARLNSLKIKREESSNQESLFDTSETDLKKALYSRIKQSYSKTLQEVKLLSRDQSLRGKLPTSSGNAFYYQKNTRKYSRKFRNDYSDLHGWIASDVQGVLNHKTRSHMASDLQRYLFSAFWTKAHSELDSPSPKSMEFPLPLAPDHKNWDSGAHADRFRTIGQDQIPLTITSHLRKDGHAQIHYDPLQNRSLTVREAARIQTFPDDYYFEGPTGEQYQQVGNAVPAFLAKQIALKILKIMKEKKLV